MRLLGSICIAIAAPLLWAGTPLPDNAIEAVRVSEVVESMQSAIERLDSGAYMAQINPSDPVLATEHRAWFAELLCVLHAKCQTVCGMSGPDGVCA